MGIHYTEASEEEELEAAAKLTRLELVEISIERLKPLFKGWRITITKRGDNDDRLGGTPIVFRKEIKTGDPLIVLREVEKFLESLPLN